MLQKKAEGVRFFGKGWTPHYFYTFAPEGRLYYSASETDTKPQGFIDLNSLRAVAASQSEKFGIDVIGQQRTTHLKAAHDKDAAYWISGLQPYLKANPGNTGSRIAQASAPAPTKPQAAPAAAVASAPAQASAVITVDQIVQQAGGNKQAEQEALTHHIKSLKDEIQKQTQSKKGLEKLVGFYAKDPEAAKKTQAEADVIESRIEKLKAAVQSLQERFNANSGASEAAQPPPPPPRDEQHAETVWIKAEALYDFAPNSEAELGFTAGTIIDVYQHGPELEWWLGEIDGVSGAFPATYARVITAEQGKALSETVIPQAEGLYDFEGASETELSFVAGEIINLLESEPGAEWWKGEVQGHVGFFPSNYVKLREF